MLIFEIINSMLCIFILIVLFMNKESYNLKSIRNEINQLKINLKNLSDNEEKTERTIRDELAKNRGEFSLNAKLGRDDLNSSLNNFREIVTSSMKDISSLQKNQLELVNSRLSGLIQSNEQQLFNMRESLEKNLKMIQDDNSSKLEKMRLTVDERLHDTLEQRLGESFKIVSDRLEMVHKGLGEMQTLAAGVGDLKKVLTNVKTRGIWGEVQLGNILEQVFSREQYEENVITKVGSNCRVEYAIKLPGKSDDSRYIFMPLDAKFPLEDYQRLLDAQEKADLNGVNEAIKSLEIRIRAEAKDICEKYLDPPNTTDFGIMFLPIEGLYAEVLRIPGLSEILQKNYRVLIAGPTTIMALLNSLQMGFRTLTIEKRTSEVWQLLGTVKSDFIKFGDILDKTHKKLQEASNSIESAATRTRVIQKRLNNVQEISIDENKMNLED